MADAIYVGSTITLEARFSVRDVATDPTTITLTIKAPSGTETSYTYAAGEIVRDAVGEYAKDVETDEAGVYTYRWEGTDACDVVNQGSFSVLPVF